jgi:hypothetical protein
MPNTGPRGIQGKHFVLPFVVVLVILCALMFAVGLRFQTIMSHLEEVRSLWPKASQKLRARYDSAASSIEKPDGKLAADNPWSELKKRFEATSQFDHQSEASTEFENQIARSLGNTWNLSDFDDPAIAKLLSADQKRKQVQSDSIGWLTIKSLRLKLPPIFEPGASSGLE